MSGDWNKRLGLAPHPEGGAFRRIHTASQSVETATGPRPVTTAIHYLLTAQQPYSRFHRVRSTILHFLQAGGPVQYACIGADGRLRETVLGYAPGEALFLEVPGDTWKASRLLPGTTEALVSEVVIPGFDWRDHQYGTAAALGSTVMQRLQSAGWLDGVCDAAP